MVRTRYLTFLCSFPNVIYKTLNGKEKDKRSAPNIEFFKHPELETLSVPSNEKCWKQLLLVRSPPHLCSNCFFSKVTSSLLCRVSCPIVILKWLVRIHTTAMKQEHKSTYWDVWYNSCWISICFIQIIPKSQSEISPGVLPNFNHLFGHDQQVQ